MSNSNIDDKHTNLSKISPSCDVDLSKQAFEIRDVDVDDLRELDEPKDHALLDGLKWSLDPCIVPYEKLLRGEASTGVVSPKQREDFVKYIEHEKQPEIMAIRHCSTGIVFGAYRYLTSGNPAAEDSDIAAAIIGKAGLISEAAKDKIGWVLDAWIAPGARPKGLYAPLTGRALDEIFKVKGMDVAVGYVRLSPCPNPALKAHLGVGWKLLDGDDKLIHIPYDMPTEAEFSAAANDPIELDYLKRNAAIAAAGGMTLGILIYTRETYEARIDGLLEREHTFVNEGDYQIFSH
jgi:hypothetical protein